MFINTKKCLDYLEGNQLSEEEHIRLLGVLNRNLNNFPLESVLIQDKEGGTLANGRRLELEELIKFRQGISALKENWAFQLLADQILYLSIQQGVHFGDTKEKILWSRTAIWFITKFREYLITFDNII